MDSRGDGPTAIGAVHLYGGVGLGAGSMGACEYRETFSADFMHAELKTN